MPAGELIVRVRRLDGQWDQLGTGQDAGVVPESLDLSTNRGGDDRATFTLKRRPDRPRLDLAHDTPIEIELAGRVWEGRIMEAPAGDTVSVICEGWQYSLDDLTFTKPYVHNDLSEWRDIRSILTAPLGSGVGKLPAYAVINQEDGALTIMLPKGTVVAAGQWGGVYLDAGPESLWRYAAVDYECSGVAAAMSLGFYCGVVDDPTVQANYTGPIQGEDPVSLGAKGYRASKCSGSRYLQLTFYINGAGTLANDVWLKAKAIRASTYSHVDGFGALPTTDAHPEPRGYVMGRRSRLRADHLIVDAVANAPQLVLPTTFESASFQDEVLGAEDLYAYYRFQEAAGATVAVDASGNARHGTIAGGPTLAQPRLLAVDAADPDPAGGAQSIQFTNAAAGQKVTVPTFDPALGFSVEAVFKTPLTAPNFQALFSLSAGAAATQYAVLGYNSANVLYWGNIDTAGQNTHSNANGTRGALVANRTYYVLATAHPGMVGNGVVFTLVLYDTVTGKLDVCVSTSSMVPTWGTTPTIEVGNWSVRAANDGFVGTVDELAIYNQPLCNPDGTSVPDMPNTVMLDARRRALAAINREAGDIKRGGFVLPTMNLQSRSPRESIEAANALHNYQAQVRPGRTFRYRALPTVPLVKIGDWAGSEFEDTSNNSGRDVVNSVKVVGTDPAGLPVLVVYSTANLPASVYAQSVADPQPLNPSFDVDASNWTAINGTMARDTVTVDTAPGSLKLTSTGGGAAPRVRASVTNGISYYAILTIGRTYALQARMYQSVNGYPPRLLVTDLSTGATLASVVGTNSPGAWQTVLAAFQPVGTWTTLDIEIGAAGLAPATTVMGYVDTVKILRPMVTLLDRQGGLRQKTLTVSQPITPAIATRLAKLYLLANMTTPFKGSFGAVDKGMRGYLDDRDVAAIDALGLPGELVHVAHRTNPDTGDLGRDGRVIQASYNNGTRKSTVTLDNTRGGFDVLLARYGVRVS